MKKLSQERVFILTALAAFIIIMLTLSNYDYNKEEKEFKSDFEPGTDSYMEDSLTYVHPDWSYERIQEELYGFPDSVIKVNKYNVYYEYNIINGDTILVDKILEPLR